MINELCVIIVELALSILMLACCLVVACMCVIVVQELFEIYRDKSPKYIDYVSDKIYKLWFRITRKGN